jgi:hypothetical protein
MAWRFFSKAPYLIWWEKKTLKKLTVLLISVFLMAPLFSCTGKKEASQKTDSDVQGKILATVNGVPITEEDVKRGSKRVVHGEKVHPEATGNILETLVRNELVYQQSLELGLEKNPEYRRKVNEAEAQLRTFKRQEMATLHREYIKSKAVVTDSRPGSISTRIRKESIRNFMYGRFITEARRLRIADDYRDLKSGKSFERWHRDDSRICQRECNPS